MESEDNTIVDISVHIIDIATRLTYFAFNASLSAVNIAKALSMESGLNLSVEDVKLLIHNTVMVQRIFSTFGKSPNLILNQPNIKELLFFGVKTAA